MDSSCCTSLCFRCRCRSSYAKRSRQLWMLWRSAAHPSCIDVGNRRGASSRRSCNCASRKTLTTSACIRIYRNWSVCRLRNTRNINPVMFGKISAPRICQCFAFKFFLNAPDRNANPSMEVSNRYSGTSSLSPNSVDWKAACTNRNWSMDRHVALSS